MITVAIKSNTHEDLYNVPNVVMPQPDNKHFHIEKR